MTNKPSSEKKVWKKFQPDQKLTPMNKMIQPADLLNETQDSHSGSLSEINQQTNPKNTGSQRAVFSLSASQRINLRQLAAASKPIPLSAKISQSKENTIGMAPSEVKRSAWNRSDGVNVTDSSPVPYQREYYTYRITTKGEQIRSENIQITPFKILSLLELTIEQKQGDHSYASFHGVVSEEEGKRIVRMNEAQLPISISKRNEKGESYSFYEGLALEIEITMDGNVYYVSGKAASYTYLMDIKRVKRSFQHKTSSYQQLVNQIVTNYQESAFLDTLSNGKKVNQFLTQHNETDWAFIQRLASHFHQLPVAIDQYKNPRFYFGLPDSSIAGEIEAYNFQAERDLNSYRSLTENQSISTTEADFFRYQVETTQLFTLGDRVKFLEEEWHVVHSQRKLEKGALLNHYLLSKSQGILQEKKYNEELTGSSLIGTVKAVQSDKVLLDLEIDSANSQPAYWFPYATNYTSDDNVGWYMMPEIGEKVRLYYPTKDEKDAVAISTVRTADDSDGSLNPAIKTLRNKFGKTITLEPDRITITGNGVEIILNDSSGINITSTGNVSVTAEGALSLKGRNVVMDASESVNISSHGNTVSVNEKIVLNGSEIKMN
ncbi:hypothetical protein IW492_14975 [Enterococcus sp. BWB1-3]|uniref:hypothetical protein n=1 Tax=Enterococcus sp. BWB1-3 TaxID=2787713 RepID=UPI0019213119|nr:hypothetical protein [Enterococcus sp. BWB1-3]MBL1230532.1 hypothetical protein [Enterococcus sp. BWB1-3]